MSIEKMMYENKDLHFNCAVQQTKNTEIHTNRMVGINCSLTRNGIFDKTMFFRFLIWCWWCISDNVAKPDDVSHLCKLNCLANHILAKMNENVISQRDNDHFCASHLNYTYFNFEISWHKCIVCFQFFDI